MCGKGDRSTSPYKMTHKSCGKRERRCWGVHRCQRVLLWLCSQGSSWSGSSPRFSSITCILHRLLGSTSVKCLLSLLPHLPLVFVSCGQQRIERRETQPYALVQFKLSSLPKRKVTNCLVFLLCSKCCEVQLSYCVWRSANLTVITVCFLKSLCPWHGLK